jgi:hypothetical protein
MVQKYQYFRRNPTLKMEATGASIFKARNGTVVV